MWTLVAAIPALSALRTLSAQLLCRSIRLRQRTNPILLGLNHLTPNPLSFDRRLKATLTTQTFHHQVLLWLMMSSLRRLFLLAIQAMVSFPSHPVTLKSVRLGRQSFVVSKEKP
jgi:hypothetical protein